MKNTRMKFFLALFLITLTSTYSLQKKQLDCEPYPYSRVALKHREHKGVGWDKGYTTLSLFLAPRNNHVLVPFLDARFHAFNNGYIASNLGVGARFAPISDNFVVGLNTYYDFREYKSFSSHQASGGIEFLTSAFDFRLNGYYPFSGKTEEKDVYFHQFRKNSAYLRQDILYSLPSADAEIGFELPEPMKQVQLYLAFGSYYLFKTHANNHSIGNAIGYKARLTATPEDYISFGVEYTHDRLFNNRVNGYISFQVPLGKKKAKTKSKHKYYKHRNECDSYYTGMRRKTQDPYHNEIIPFYDETHTFNANRVTSSPRRFIFVNNTNLDPQEIGSGSGTFEDPYTTLKLGELNSAPGDIIYVFYGRGNDDGYNKGFIFKNQQILTGSGVDLELESFYIPAYTPGKNPYASNQLNLSSNTILAESIDNIVLHGFNLSSKDSSTISLRDVSAKIMNNVITTQAGQNSLEHLGVRDSTLRLNSFNQPVMIDGSTNSATYYSIINNTFSTSSGNTLTLIDPSLSTLIANNSFYSFAPTGRAVFFSNIMSPNGPTAAIYRNNIITDGFAEGFVHNSNNREATSVIFENNTIASNLNTAIIHYSTSEKGTLLCQNNTVKSSKKGIYVIFAPDSNLSCYIEKNYIKTSQNCLELYADSKGNATITDNTLYGDGLGVVISNASDQRTLMSFNVQNNKISTFQYGIDIQNTNNSLGSTYGSITGNSIDDGLGIRLLIDNASGNICSTIVNNRGFGFGRFNATTSPGSVGSIVVKLNPGTFEENNPGFKFVTVSGNVNFVPIQTSCPSYLPVIYVNNTNNNPYPDGSLSNPYPTLKQAQEFSKTGDVIYVFPGDGTTKGYDQGIELKAYQTIGSPAITFTADGITFQGDGSPEPKITSSTGPVIAAADGCSIKGLNIIPNVDIDGIVTTNAGSLVEISNNTILTSGAGKAMIINSPKTIVSQNTITMNDTSEGIIHLSTEPFTQQINLIFENNNFISNKTGYFEDFSYFDIDLSSSSVNSVVTFNQNNASQTKRNFLLLGSLANNNLEIDTNTFDNSDNGLLLASKGNVLFLFNGNSSIAQPINQNSLGSVNIGNSAAFVVETLTSNTFVSKDGSPVAGINFSMGNNLCLQTIAQNSPKNTDKCVFYFTKDNTAPSTPALNITNDEALLKAFNPQITFDFENPIIPSYSTPCP